MICCFPKQELVKICEPFASNKSFKFSIDVDPEKSESKCMIFSKKSVDSRGFVLVMLSGDPLPWVPQVKLLGILLKFNNSINIEMAEKMLSRFAIECDADFSAQKILSKTVVLMGTGDAWRTSLLVDFLKASKERLSRILSSWCWRAPAFFLH